MHHPPPEEKDLVRPPPAKALALELQEVNEASVSWQEVCPIHFLSIGAREVQQAIARAPDIFLLAGAGCRQHRGIAKVIGLVLDDVVGSPRQLAAPRGPREGEIDIRLWPPTVAKKVGAPSVKTSLERRSEGKFTSALPNKNA